MPATSFHPDFQPEAFGDIYLVTGSREYVDLDEVEAWGASLPPGAYLMDGMARGVDNAAFNGFYKRHPSQQSMRRPARWAEHGRAAGLARNGEMVDECAVLASEGWRVHVHAFWDGISRGTKDCIERALATGFTVTVHQVGQPPETWSC